MRYTSDLTDAQWEQIKEYFPAGNKSKYDKRELVNAVLYLVKTGCQWRNLPKLALEKEDCFTFADAIIEAVGSSDYVMQRIRHIFSHQGVLQNEIPYLITSMFSPLVVTTNYDKLLEDASVNSPLGVLRPLLPCLTGQMNEAILLNERRLLKIHGSIEETTSFVFSSEQYKTAYGEKGNRENKFLPNLLYKIFTARAVLFYRL